MPLETRLEACDRLAFKGDAPAGRTGDRHHLIIASGQWGISGIGVNGLAYATSSRPCVGPHRSLKPTVVPARLHHSALGDRPAR